MTRGADRGRWPGNWTAGTPSLPRVTITRSGKPAAVLISPEDLASLEETLDILSDPATLTRLRKAQAEVKRGEVLTLDELLDSLPKGRGGRR